LNIIDKIELSLFLHKLKADSIAEVLRISVSFTKYILEKTQKDDTIALIRNDKIKKIIEIRQ